MYSKQGNRMSSQFAETLMYHMIGPSLTLLGGGVLVRWQINHLLKKSEQNERDISKVKQLCDTNSKDEALKLKDVEISLGKMVVQSMTEIAKINQDSMANISKMNQESLNRITESFTKAMESSARMNIENRAHLENQLSILKTELMGLIGKGEISIEDLKKQIHSLELRLIRGDKDA